MIKSKSWNLQDHPHVTNFVILDDRRTAGEHSGRAPWDWTYSPIHGWLEFIANVGTLPKFKMEPENGSVWNRRCLLETIIFRFHVVYSVLRCEM